jgi:branched-subunit amino acid ABC-type transport system permease component
VSLVVQVIVTGLAAGGVYGIFAVGYSLIYRLTGVVYFAFGDLVAFGVFTTLLVAAGTGPVSQTSLGLGRFLFALAVGLVLCIGVGAATYVLFIEPYLLRGSTVGWVASTLAIAFALRGMIGAARVRVSGPVPLRERRPERRRLDRRRQRPGSVVLRDRAGRGAGRARRVDARADASRAGPAGDLIRS